MARRQQAAGGLDIVGVITNIPVAVTFLLAIAGWWTAFIGQIIFEHKWDQARQSGSGVGVSWFSIFLQLAITIALFLVLAQGTLEIYRFQLTAFISVLVVFAVIGTNQGIFGSISSQTAIGAGWLLLAIVDILWLLFITADDETRLALVFSSYASEVPPNRTRSMMRQSRRTSSALGISNNQSSATDLHSHHTHHNVNAGNGFGGGGAGNGGMATYGSGGAGYGLSKGGTAGSIHSMQSSQMNTPGIGGGYGNGNGSAVSSPALGNGNGGMMMGNNNNNNGMAARSVTPIGQQHQSLGHQASLSQGKIGSIPAGAAALPPSSQSLAQQQAAPSTTAPVSSAAPGVGAGAGGAAATPQNAAALAASMKPPFEMKASFSYSASADDPNEISFVKGEIMTILDNSGKWFNARKQDGSEGIVPSNYLTFPEP